MAVKKILFLRVWMLCSLLLTLQEAMSQETAVQSLDFKRHRLHYRLSYELLKMDSEPDLGMVGIGADFFLADRLPNLYLTLNSYSAVAGKRPGLITFGTGVGYLQPLFHSPLALDAGVFIGGGGGGGAPDGGGLITREHLNLTYRWGSVSVSGGYSRMDFPTGAMGSHNINFGLSLSSIFNTAHPRADHYIHSGTSSADLSEPENQMDKSRIRINLSTLSYLKFAKGPTFTPRSPDAPTIHLMGMELDKFINDRLYAALKLHGAIAGGIDGYMSYLIGMGFEQPLGTESLKLDAQLLAGPSGGGDIASGGGGIVQGSLGLRVPLGAHYGIKAALGHTVAPGGNLSGTFGELALSRDLNFLYPRAGSPASHTAGAEDRLHHFSMEFLNRTYISPDAQDKNGIVYDRMFNLLGFGISKKFSRHFSVIGSTYWAYQGSYGAYAEGLLGLRYHYPFSHGWELQAHILTGAAGGGGIDLGSGLVFQYGAVLYRAIGGSWGLALAGGQMQGFQGNFTPFFADLGITYRFSQIEQK